MEQKSYSPKASEILDVAESHMRKGGFDAISFRDLATAVGVKSASVHYHFPQKSDLGQAVVARYRERVIRILGDPASSGSAVEKLGMLFAVYTGALNDGDSVCLCCILGAEAHYLPEEVSKEVALFFQSLTDWTREALSMEISTANAADLSMHIISALQGAMVLSVALDNDSHLRNTQKMLLRFLGQELTTE